MEASELHENDGFHVVREGDALRIVSWIVNEQEWPIKSEFNELMGYFGTDVEGNIYLEVYEEVPNCIIIAMERTIRKYNSDGELVGIARFDFDKCTRPMHDVFVNKNGDVFIMETFEDELRISKLILGDGYVSNLDELTEYAKAAET